MEELHDYSEPQTETKEQRRVGWKLGDKISDLNDQVAQGKKKIRNLIRITKGSPINCRCMIANPYLRSLNE